MTRNRWRGATGVVAMVLLAGACASGAGRTSSVTTSGHAPTTRRAAQGAPGARPSAGCRSGTAGSASSTTASTVSGASTMSLDGVERTYSLAAQRLRQGVPAPVIVLLHGMGQTAEAIDAISDLPRVANAAGMIVITPQATGSPTMWQPSGTGPDAEFIGRLLEQVGSTHCVDTARIYLVGFSVGAVMAASYACAHQDQIAAIAALSVQFPSNCTKPLSMIAFHGTADPIVPYAPGGKGAIGGGAGTEANMAAWAKLNGCAAEPETTSVAVKVDRLVWPHCPDGVSLELYRTTGGGHDWPGSATNGDPIPRDEAVDASKLIVAFLPAHHLAA